MSEEAQLQPKLLREGVVFLKGEVESTLTPQERERAENALKPA